MKPEVYFSWQEGDMAEVYSFTCICGNELDMGDGKIVESGEEEQCPKCRRTYIYRWLGFDAVEKTS